MWSSKLSRRRFLGLSGSAVAVTILNRALGQGAAGGSGAGEEMLHIGVVLPTTGDPTLGTFGGEALVGTAANDGAMMAAEEIFGIVGPSGRHFKALISSAPDTRSMVRAAERMASEEGAFAIVGGFSAEDAQALSSLAAKRNFVFLNVGAQSDSLRGMSCDPHTFHLAASASMYLDAMTVLGTKAGFQRWFFVYDDTDEQRAKLAAAERVLLARHAGSTVGVTMVAANEPLYTDAFADIAKAQPDVVVLLLTPNEQLVFLGQYETSSLDAKTMGYPSPAAQTRQFYAASLQNVQSTSSAEHLALWESTLSTGGAADLNFRHLGHYGLAMDPSAWAAYVGIKIMAEAAVKADSVNSTELIKYMEDVHTGFDIYKGAGTSFRPWDHQMRQPLYVIKTNRDFQDSTSLQDLAVVESELPETDESNLSAKQRLDQFGVGEADSECQIVKTGQ